MQSILNTVAFCAIFCNLVVEANHSLRAAPKDEKVQHLSMAAQAISPKLKPKSDKVFFKKDYPFDQRPKADPFHFKHPYPIVQDSGDFDSDFVKDENSDNGSWKAQETYDRLRTKLRREKRDLAKALATKREDEDRLQSTMKRHDKEKAERQEAEKKADSVRRELEEEEAKERARRENNKKQEEKLGGVSSGGSERQGKSKSGEESRGASGGASGDAGANSVQDKDVDVSTKDTEKAMNDLEDCKKQLAEAREELKKLMKELEDAKEAQSTANSVLDESLKKEVAAREKNAAMKKAAKSEYGEYQDAKDAYDKQLALVSKLRTQLRVAEAKVRAMRDGEDKSGGVYPTPSEAPAPKSGAPAGNWPWAPLLSLAAAMALA